jgi:hypothetical protein
VTFADHVRAGCDAERDRRGPTRAA